MVYRPDVDEQLCFVLIPFREHFPDYFRGILAPAAAAAGLLARKADDIYGTAPIIRDIWESIWKAKLVIADVTGRNPNVNYELGICHALGVPTILITQTLDDVPFDYKHRRCIRYDTEELDWQDKLRKSVTLTIRAVLDGSAISDELTWPYDTDLMRRTDQGGPFVRATDAREELTKGISHAREAIAMAYGFHGASLSIASQFEAPRSGRSGPAIAGAFSSPNPLVQRGLEEVRSVIREAANELGDGTKTAALLFCDLVLSGFRALQAGAILRDLVHEMDVAVEAAVEALHSGSFPAVEKTIPGVALTAALGDDLVGKIAVEAIRGAGPDGVTYLERSNDLETRLTIRPGMYFERGFLSPKFITDVARQAAVLTDAYILICSLPLTSMRSLLPILEQIARAGASLLVMADNVEGEALATLAVNVERGTLASVAVRAPGFQNRLELLEDIAIWTGGTVVSDSVQLEALRLTQLGRAGRVEITKDSTWITDPKNNKELVSSRATGLRQQISVTPNDRDREALQERLAKLTAAVSVIRVGGASAVDRDDRIHRTESALHAIRSARASGVVVGAGCALWRAGRTTRDSAGSRGGKIVDDAMTAPLLVQLRNSNQDLEEIMRDLSQARPNTGFNAARLQLSDLAEDGVLDPAQFAIRGLQIAFSHARNVLQTGAFDISAASPSSPNIQSV
jgi:chaperonin GroEL